nr:MAG TPA: upper collar protein [Caudoviricetes sp.]
MRLDKLERRLYKIRRNRLGKDTDENLYGDNFTLMEQDYYRIYSDYLTNLVLNLITYENAPNTLDERFLEFNLRYYGFARVGGVDQDNVFVLGQNQNGEYGLNALGSLIDQSTIPNPFSVDDKTKELPYLTRVNYREHEAGYVTLTNKYNYYMSGLMGTFTDMQLIDRVSKSLAKIKASEMRNVDMMKQQFIGLTKNKNLTANQVYQQIQEGQSFIGIDEDLGDITRVLDVTDFNIHDYLASLKTAWNNEVSELLTMLGINTVGVDKKERLVSMEAEANAQLTEASANVYLQARNQQLEILNEVLGTKIEATFNQQAFQQLVKLQDAQNAGQIDVDMNNDGLIDNEEE